MWRRNHEFGRTWIIYIEIKIQAPHSSSGGSLGIELEINSILDKI